MRIFSKRWLVLVMLIMLVGMPHVAAQETNELTLLYWQSVSTLNPYLSSGTKDLHAASLMLEPLARYDETGTLVAWLARDIPTVENGGISDDLLTITWHLQEDILWSDGTPFTADDVVFTWNYCTDEAMACVQASAFKDVEQVIALDDWTVVITFSQPKPFPYTAFVGQSAPILQRAQFADCLGEAAITCSEQNATPIGTGAYVVERFRANDVVTFTANPHYRVAGQPYFERVILKGGGDAESAARAVLQTGEADYAWNLQIAPAILDQMLADSEGVLATAYGTRVERLILNQTNPDPTLGEQRSVYLPDGRNDHPFLRVPAVYQALSMAIDRQALAENLYGAGGQASCNVIAAPAIYASTANDDCLAQDIDGANALLDAVDMLDRDGDGVRETPDGVPLRLLYQTSTNAVRQSTQVLIKDWWSQIGVEAELRNINPGVFFGNDPASPDTFGRFYADIQMYTAPYNGTDPENYLSTWACDQIGTPDNDWQGSNVPRFCLPAYDTLVAELAQTASLDERAALVRQMNDLLVQNGITIPLVHRASISAHAGSLDGVRMNTWDSELWNIAEWSRAE